MPVGIDHRPPKELVLRLQQLNMVVSTDGSGTMLPTHMEDVLVWIRTIGRMTV